MCVKCEAHARRWELGGLAGAPGSRGLLLVLSLGAPARAGSLEGDKDRRTLDSGCSQYVMQGLRGVSVH